MTTIKEKEPSEQFIAHAVSGYKPKRRPWTLPTAPQIFDSSTPAGDAFSEDRSKSTPAKKAGDAEMAGVTGRDSNTATPAISAGADPLVGLKKSVAAEKASHAETAGDDLLASPAKKAGGYSLGLAIPTSPAEKSGDAEKAAQHFTSDRGGSTSSLHTHGWKLTEGISRFTRVPHCFTNCLEKEDFSHREYRLLMLLLRETLGWGRACVVLRSKELLDRTKIPERHLRDTIKALQGRGVIFVEDRKTTGGQSLPSAFALNPKYFEIYETPAISTGDAQTAGDAESAGSPPDQSAGETPQRARDAESSLIMIPVSYTRKMAA